MESPARLKASEYPSMLFVSAFFYGGHNRYAESRRAEEKYINKRAFN